MGQFLFYYQRPEPATWVYLSSFLVIGIYFMFHRLWSLRNLDILLIIFLTPGLMMVYEGRKKAADLASKPVATAEVKAPPVQDLRDDSKSSEEIGAQTSTGPPPDAKALEALATGEPNSDEAKAKEAAKQQAAAVPTAIPLNSGQRLQFWGFVTLLSVSCVWVLRMILDTLLVRRPLLEPNLSSGGLAFIGVSLFLFLMANIITSTPEEHLKQSERLGPGYVLLNMLPAIETIPSEMSVDEEDLEAAHTVAQSVALSTVARVLAIVANLILTVGMVAIGYWHFGNLRTGIGAATLFLLLPYTAQMTGHVDHVLPGAMLVMAVLFYRAPVFSGLFLGCAAGLVYYPFFLLPLWLSFYWERGVRRFTIGFVVALFSLTLALAISSGTNVTTHLQQMYGVFRPATEGLGGVWGLGWYPFFRFPVLVAFLLFCLSFVFWPAQKNLATLMSCTGAIMTASQFWHGYGGGLYMAWFLPLVMLTVFRPNLDDRIALAVVRPLRKSKKSTDTVPTDPPLAQAG